MAGLRVLFKFCKDAPVTMKALPTSPVLGPIVVNKPTLSNKVYRWCACGQSTKQPFCDGSHKGTQFIPLKFTVEESVQSMELCGCKYSSKAPFCDNETCLKLRQQQQEQQ